MKSGCESKRERKGRSVELPVLAAAPAGNGSIAPSRTSRWRAATLITINVLMAIHIIQWWLTGSTLSPIEPSETMYTLQNGAVNAGFIFFMLAIASTLVFGRFVCGWGCHIVALQDLCAWMLKKAGLTPRPFRSRLLMYVPLLAALYMFVWPTVSSYLAAPKGASVFPQFTNHLVTTEFWATFPPVAVAIPFLLICGFATVYFLGSKGFCTYGCPYGGFFSIADKAATGRIRVTDACEQCGHCTAVCTSNVLVHAEVKQHGMVVDPGCMKCMDCVSVCPNDALYFGFGKPSLAAGGSVAKNYSLSWPEEIAAAGVFAASFMAAWDVYQLVPMLMALGIASVTTFLVYRTWRLARQNDLTFYKYTLRSQGKIKTAGWAFLCFSVLWTGLNAHSGWVRYHERGGAMAFASLQIPDELALAQRDPSQWLGQSDIANVEAGRRHFHDAVDLGLFVNVDALSKFAWLEYLAGDTERAVDLLDKAAGRQQGQAKALSLYYRGAILNRLGRHEPALASVDAALAERSDLVAALEEKGEALWRLGRKREAEAAWNDAVSAKASLPLAYSFLAGAAAADGRSEDAARLEDQAEKYTPKDPYFHWMLGLRLEGAGMQPLANKHFGRAVQIDAAFRLRRKG